MLYRRLQNKEKEMTYYMALDVKQQVLVAIYMEYQKDLPKMKDIVAEKLGISREKFFAALDKLDNEGLVHDIKLIRGCNGAISGIAIIDCAVMSASGLEYIEKKFDVERTLSSKEKVEKVVNEVAKRNLEHLKDFGDQVLLEIVE